MQEPDASAELSWSAADRPAPDDLPGPLTVTDTATDGPTSTRLPETAEPPLAVDLDGTLVRTDLLVESLLLLLKRQPLHLFAALLWWLRGGRANLKAQLAQRVMPDPLTLPYRRCVLEHLRQARATGRRVVLATGADAGLAARVAAHLGLFEAVLASDGQTNLTGSRKRSRLVDEFGEQGFDYLGDGDHDHAVRRSARISLVVGRRPDPDPRVQWLQDPDAGSARDLLRELRMHQWVKNVLVFVPLLASHRIVEPEHLAVAALAFAAFGLCASSVYVLNDLMDLGADRRHPSKRHRPLASGKVSMAAALTIIPVLLVGALLIGLLLPWGFMALLALYFLVNVAYSLRLKSVVILDVLVLATLYTLRIAAGSAAVDIWPSTWLLAFSMFAFLSLALVKRYAELMTMRAVDGPTARARGYRLDDAELLSSLGGGAGYLSVLVLALYIDSASGQALYRTPELLWGICPLLLYWDSYLWLMAHRGLMHDDPLVFAQRDKVSRILLVLMVVVWIIAM
ncbi:MAG: UbiA family prenyltransferase [Gammaproteobacteria bacterium]|nr:UbiA family prenyltransferase [Gammaproteobacteria bacterium]